MRFSCFISMFMLLITPILQIETNGEVKVALNSAALELPVKGIEKLHIDFWPIESALSRLDSVVDSSFVAEALQRLFKGVLSLVPDLIIPDFVIRPSFIFVFLN